MALYADLSALCALAWTILVYRHVAVVKVTSYSGKRSGLEHEGRGGRKPVKLVCEGRGYVRWLLTRGVELLGVGRRGRVGEW